MWRSEFCRSVLRRPEEDQYRSNALAAAIMLGLVVLVMIVAAVNVTNLLAHATSRRQELAIRAALGAGRGRLVRQMVTESLMLGDARCAVLLEQAARVLAAMRLPGDLPVRFDFHRDGRVLVRRDGRAGHRTARWAPVPAVRVSGADLDRTLRQSRHGSPGTHGHRIRGFPVAQIAFCFVLLAAAGLFVRSPVRS